MTAPAVAWVGVGSNVGKVMAGDADAGWDGSLSVDTVTFIEGTASLGEKVSATTTELYTVNTTDIVGEPFDFSASGGNDGDHIFGWIMIFAAWDTLTAGGFGLRVADDLATDSIGTWYVGPQAGYVGGWASYVINPSADFDGVIAGTASWTTGGNPAQLSGVDGFGVRWKVTVSITGNTDNSFIDAISVGQGYRMTLGDAGSSEGTFGDLLTFEETTTTGRFGGLRQVSGIIFAKCKIFFGVASGAGDTEVIDTGFVVVWEQQVLSDGSTSAVAADFYELSFSEGDDTTTVDLSSGSLAAVAPHTVLLDFSGITTVTLAAVTVDRALSVTLDTACTWTDSTIKNSGLVTLAGAIFSGMVVAGSTVAANASALSWDFNADPDGELDDLNITMGALNHHAIEFGTNAPLTMTLTNWVTSGFHASDDNDSSTLLFADRGSDVTWTVNIINGSGTFSFRKLRAGDTVVIVIDPVMATITVTDIGTGNPIENARVLLVAADGTGDLPFEESIVSINRSGSVATVDHTGHGMATNDFALIAGATEEEYNGCFLITVTGVDDYTYVVPGTPSTPAGGSKTSTGGYANTLTNASGIVSFSRSVGNDQPMTGKVGMGSSSPFYKPSPLTVTFDQTTGLVLPVQLIRDE